MDFDERVDGYPEVLMPLWGVAPRHRDKHPAKKAAFWKLLDQKHRALEHQVDKRVAHPRNLQLCEMDARAAEGIEEMANRDPMATIQRWLLRYEEKTAIISDERRDLEPAEDIAGKLKEVTPQMVLRPLPKVEREEPDETPWNYIAPLPAEVANRILDLSREQQLQSITPQLLTRFNMDTMLAHRRFHQQILHQTDWTKYLSEDQIEVREGPRWMWNIWEHWDGQLDPMPMDERPSQSGYLMGDEVYPMKPPDE